jgi:predicted AAA+ superfamily ATPase
MATRADAFFEQLVRDCWERSIPKLISRDAPLPSLPGKVDAVVGVRRSGKTYYLYQEMGRLFASGIARERVLYVNFEDERLLPMAAEELARIPEALYRLRPDLRDETVWFFLDEVQNVPGWERFVRRLLDGGHARIAVTGSSSKLLAREVATTLRGRSLSTEILPFSFREALRHEGVEPPDRRRPSSKLRSLLDNRLGAHLRCGGFPEVQRLDDDLRGRVLQEYVDVAVFRDVVERHGVSNTPALRRMVRHLLTAPGCFFSVHKFYNSLRSQGLRISKDSLYAYLEHLSDAYLVLAVPIHAASERARMVNPPKVYPVDPGLAEAFSPLAGADEGRRLENAVYLELRRRGFQVEYLKTRGGWEVDFFATPRAGRSLLFQAALTLRDPAVREREIRALREAMGGETREAVIVTRNEDEEIRVPEGTIHAVPAWAWLLGME